MKKTKLELTEDAIAALEILIRLGMQYGSLEVNKNGMKIPLAEIAVDLKREIQLQIIERRAEELIKPSANGKSKD